jgi:predicted nucleic acid-binding protein
MIVVLDCSAAIEIILNREKGRTLRTVLESAERVTTSEIYRAEAANTFWKYCRAGYLNAKDCGLLLRMLKILSTIIRAYPRTLLKL